MVTFSLPLWVWQPQTAETQTYFSFSNMRMLSPKENKKINQLYCFRPCMLNLFIYWPSLGGRLVFGRKTFAQIVGFQPWDRKFCRYSHDIRWNKCISHWDKKPAAYQSHFERQPAVFHRQHSFWLIATIVDLGNRFINMIHYPHDSNGIITLTFLVLMTACQCRPGVYQKIVNLGQWSWLIFDIWIWWETNFALSSTK